MVLICCDLHSAYYLTGLDESKASSAIVMSHVNYELNRVSFGLKEACPGWVFQITQPSSRRVQVCYASDECLLFSGYQPHLFFPFFLKQKTLLTYYGFLFDQGKVDSR